MHTSFLRFVFTPTPTVYIFFIDMNKLAKDLSHVPCKFFRVGSCTAGSSCPFSHNILEPGQQKDVCAWFVKGNCKFGHKCALAHILPGQAMSMDRRNKKAAQLAAASGGGQKDRDRERDKEARAERSAGVGAVVSGGITGSANAGGTNNNNNNNNAANANATGGNVRKNVVGGPVSGVGRPGSTTTQRSNSLLSGSTAPTRMLPSGMGARPPLPISKAVPAPAEPAPSLNDTDFTSSFDELGKQENGVNGNEIINLGRNGGGGVDDGRTHNAVPINNSLSPPPGDNKGAFPVSTPSQPHRFTGRHGSSSSVDFGPVGSPPRASPTNPIRINGFSPGTSPLDGVQNTMSLTANLSAPGQPSSLFMTGTENRSSLTASLSTGPAFNVGSLPILSRNTSTITDSFADVLEEDNMEEFVPSSLKDLLTPEEQNRRMSRTASSAATAVVGGIATSQSRGGVAGLQQQESARHKHSRSVPGNSLLSQDLRSIWADAGGELGTPQKDQLGSGVGFGISPSTGNLGTPSSFKAFHTGFENDGPSPSMLHPSNASAAFLGLHHYMNRPQVTGVRAVSQGNIHHTQAHPGLLQSDLNGNSHGISPSPSHPNTSASLLTSGRPPFGTDIYGNNSNNGNSSSNLATSKQRPIPPQHGVGGVSSSSGFLAGVESGNQHLSPSARALQSHAPGQSLPQGLAAGYSRIHLQPPMASFSPSSVGSAHHLAEGTGSPGAMTTTTGAGGEWGGAKPQYGSYSDAVSGHLSSHNTPTISAASAVGAGGVSSETSGTGEQTSATSTSTLAGKGEGHGHGDMGQLTQMFSHLSYSSVAASGLRGASGPASAGLGMGHAHAMLSHGHGHGPGGVSGSVGSGLSGGISGSGVGSGVGVGVGVGGVSGSPAVSVPLSVSRRPSARGWGNSHPLSSPLSGPVLTNDDDDLFSMDEEK